MTSPQAAISEQNMGSPCVEPSTASQKFSPPVVTNDGDEDDEWSVCSEPVQKLIDDDDTKMVDTVRKASVAVGGGALTALGLVMIPLPTPLGCVVAAAGMSVLGTEFPAAQRVLDQTREKVVEVLERDAYVVVKNDGEVVEQQGTTGEDSFVVLKKENGGDERTNIKYSLQKALKAFEGPVRTRESLPEPPKGTMWVQNEKNGQWSLVVDRKETPPGLTATHTCN